MRAIIVMVLPACFPGEGESADPTCAAYCASVTAKCTGGAAQYASADACLTACNGATLAWALGTKADAAGNTLGCRQYHAGAAANDAHCLHAGPTGGAVCGSYCDVYCDAALANCTGANQLYTDTTTCHAACERFPENGALNDAGGDSVQCRLFHLGAAKTAPNDHCAQASAAGDDVCGTWCEVYCDLMLEACPGTYTGAANCDTACSAFPNDGERGDTTGDTVQCRLFHAGAANNDSHCTHASAASTAEACQ